MANVNGNGWKSWPLLIAMLMLLATLLNGVLGSNRGWFSSTPTLEIRVDVIQKQLDELKSQMITRELYEQRMTSIERSLHEQQEVIRANTEMLNRFLSSKIK